MHSTKTKHKRKEETSKMSFEDIEKLRKEDWEAYKQAVHCGTARVFIEEEIAGYCHDPELIMRFNSDFGVLNFSKLEYPSRVLFRAICNRNCECGKQVFELMKQQKQAGIITKKEYHSLLNKEYDVPYYQKYTLLEFACNSMSTEMAVYLLKIPELDVRCGKGSAIRYVVHPEDDPKSYAHYKFKDAKEIETKLLPILKAFLTRQLIMKDVFLKEDEIDDYIFMAFMQSMPLQFIYLNMFKLHHCMHYSSFLKDTNSGKFMIREDHNTLWSQAADFCDSPFE